MNNKKPVLRRQEHYMQGLPGTTNCHYLLHTRCTHRMMRAGRVLHVNSTSVTHNTLLTVKFCFRLELPRNHLAGSCPATASTDRSTSLVQLLPFSLLAD